MICSRNTLAREMIKRKKEGRGELKHKALKSVFTEEIGEQLKSELLECYEIR